MKTIVYWEWEEAFNKFGFDDWQAKTRSAPAMALYARRAAEDWQTQVRGVLADEYEIYVDCTTDPTPLTYDEWLNR
jgi:hypothetical protein